MPQFLAVRSPGKQCFGDREQAAVCCVSAVAASQLDFADLSIFARSFAVLSDGPIIEGGGVSLMFGLNGHYVSKWGFK